MIQEFSFEIIGNFRTDKYFNSESILIYVISAGNEPKSSSPDLGGGREGREVSGHLLSDDRSVEQIPRMPALGDLNDGVCELEIGGRLWKLRTDELAYIPAFCKHQWKSVKKSVIAVLKFNMKLMNQSDVLDKFFICSNSFSDKGVAYEKLKKLYFDMIYEYIMHGSEVNARKKGLFYLLLDELYTNFKHPLLISDIQTSEESRLENILNHIHKSFSESISLEKMAGMLYMSPSVFSRYFKKNMGISFADYLVKIRLSYACEQLQYTKRRVTDIAMDSGFSNASSFNKFFKKYKQMSPLEYRNQVKSTSDTFRDKSRENVQILHRFLETRMDKPQNGIIKRTVFADVSEYSFYKKIWNKALNVGAAAELLSGEQQKHILILKKFLNLQYVRIMNLFSKEMHIRQGYHAKYLNFDLLDNVLDFLVENQLQIILDMGNKRKAILNTDQDKVYELKEEPVFCGLSDACSFIESFIMHILMRYGEDTVGHWIFDISYEEEEYHHAEEYTFQSYYTAVFRLIKSKVPGALVGIYGGTPGMPEFEWVKTWKNSGIFPDFISVSILPYWPKKMPDGTLAATRSMDPEFLTNMTDQLKYELKQAGLGHLKIIATEWNLNISDRNYVNDSQEFAAQLIDMINRLLEAVDLAVYTFASDLNLRYFETAQPFFGGKGLLSKDGLFKPSCYALSLYSRMEDYLIQKGKGYIVTGNTKGKYTILCYNAKEFSPEYYRFKGSGITPDMMETIFPDKNELEISFCLSGLENGEYTEKMYILDKSNSALKQWELLGKKESLTPEELDYLNKICVPRMRNHTIKVKDSQYIRFIRLHSHEIRLIQLSIVSGQYL